MRPFLQWREDWMLGCGALDDQHLELAERMNQLYLFLTDIRHNLRKEPDGLKQRLSELCEEIRHHFQEEEALMEACGYPGLGEHHREHVMLLAEMQECLREIQVNMRLFTLNDLKSLKFWQIGHVTTSDREFAEFLNTRATPLIGKPTLTLSA